MIRLRSAVAAIASSVSLAACGGSTGAGDFAAQTSAACVKENGEAAAANCACSARLMDDVFNDRERAAFVAYLLNDEPDPEKAWKQATDRGMTIEDFKSMTLRMAEVGPRIDKECPKKPA